MLAGARPVSDARRRGVRRGGHSTGTRLDPPPVPLRQGAGSSLCRPECGVAAVACQQWRYNDEAGTFVVHTAGGDSDTPLCLRHFPEAKSFAAWTCSGAADERFVPDGAAAGATAFCTGEGEARACVVLADSFDP